MYVSRIGRFIFSYITKTTMKLTTDIIDNAPIIYSPLKQVTLQLRNCRLTSVDYLPGNFEGIDLTNNQLIEVVPNTTLPQLHTLLLNNNKELYLLDSTKFPNLRSLAARNCNLKLNHIKSWDFKLDHLIILDNPISTVEDYRLIMLHIVPSLITLDGKKVKQSEREASIEMFKGKTIEDFVGETKIDNKKLLEQLKNATDIEEIERLERLLKN